MNGFKTKRKTNKKLKDLLKTMNSVHCPYFKLQTYLTSNTKTTKIPFNTTSY